MKTTLLASLLAAYIAVAAWAAFEPGTIWADHLLPGPLLMVLIFPAFIGAVLVTGNPHAPHAFVVGLLVFLQWGVIGVLAGRRLFGRPSGRTSSQPPGNAG